MASPFGHALVGLGLFNLCYPRVTASRAKTLMLYGLVILGACFPDLDFLPGLFLGHPGRFHHGLFHSLGMAVGLSLTIGAFMAFFGKPPSFLKSSIFVFALIFSHLLLDFFTEDPKSPFGFPVFWPVSDVYFISPWWFLPQVERNYALPHFWDQVRRVMLVESLFFIPFFLYSLKERGWRKKNE
jgi:inner membrane protein